MREKRKYTFIRWIKHWYQFNKLAIKLKVWKFHHLFHDIDKPFINIFKSNYYTHVIHNLINKHHLNYIESNKINYTDMIIDWECARFTKPDKPLNAELTFLNYIYPSYDIDSNIKIKIIQELKRFKLMDSENANSAINNLSNKNNNE